MMTGKYHLPRQRHLGDFLDWLERQGHLTWTWDYDRERRRAGYVVVRDDNTSWLDTKQAESLALHLATELGLIWEPAGGHGSAKEVTKAIDRMVEQVTAGEGALPDPWSQYVT